jgi:CHAT domain-containing protein
MFPEAEILLGPNASEQEMVRLAESGELRRYGTIHLATHALVDDERPERSALILSQVNLPDPLEAAEQGTRIFDGLLTVKEILGEWDLDADLVTLSACESGLGKETPGEGYVGLASAFLRAGARSLLVSLWPVNDRATYLLMRRFYENLTEAHANGRGMQTEPTSKAEALQEAKRWLRSHRDEKGGQPFRHPAYWAGFILIGES